MIMLILDDEQLIELQDLNASGSEFRKLEPVPLADGRRALNSDLLMDLDPGETWWHYRVLLLDLPAETVVEFAATTALN